MTKPTEKQVLVAFILVAIAFVAGAATQYDSEIKQIATGDLTEIEVQGIVERYLRTDEGREYLMQQVIRTDVWNEHMAAFNAIDVNPAHSHPEYAVVAHNHNQYSISSHTHSSSSGNNGDFDLTLDKRNLEVGDSFLLEGNGPRDTRYVAIMESPNHEQSQTGTTNVNGKFTVAFVIPSSWDDGRYAIEVFIGDERDTINFDVDP